MEPYNDGVADHSKAAPGEDTHVRRQGDDVQVDDNGIVEPYIVRRFAPYCRSSCVDQDVGEARTRFARPANPVRSCPKRIPLDSIDETNNPIEDRKANHQNHFHSAFIPTWLDVQPKDPNVVRTSITATDADEATIDVAIEAAAGEDEDSQRVEQTNSHEQLKREQDQVRYRILLDAIRGQFQGTGSPNTPFNPMFRDTGTVEELTASQFRTVYDYIVSNNILRDLVKYLKVPHRETTLMRTEDHEAAAQIIHSLRLTLSAAMKPRILSIIWLFFSAVAAHYVLHHRVTLHDEEDVEYTHLMQANMPETLDPSSYIEILQWWRENYSDALMIHNTRGYLRTHEVDRMLQEQQGQQYTMTAHTTQPPQPIRQITTQAPAHTGPATSVSGSSAPFGSAESATSAQLPVVIPQFVRPQQTPTTRTDGRSEARQEHRGQRRTRPTSPDQRSEEVCPAKESYEDTQRRTPRQRQQDSTTRTQHRRPAPPTEEDRPGPSRRRSPTPMPAPEDVWQTPNTYQWEESPAAQIYPPLPQPPKGVACVFCNHLDHFSGDCPKHISLTDRVEILKDHMLCCNCLRQHRGECVRRDPCSRCNREGHHRVVCIDNPTVAIDVRGTKDHIYEQMADYTYRPDQALRRPSGREDHTGHQLQLDTRSHLLPATSVGRRLGHRYNAVSRSLRHPSAVTHAPRQHRPSSRNFCRSPPRAPSPARREASSKDEDKISSGGGSWKLRRQNLELQSKWTAENEHERQECVMPMAMAMRRVDPVWLRFDGRDGVMDMVKEYGRSSGHG
ncbi:unnamed protein product [Heligmosomoides polygyrus]|uniref:CCHC-type domain-containing protein n=1 Tax=Heligmosomoides polygyrus TaxID=6339 RepID=A0A183GAB2_HELPZ|nr:unnamed protein product [Heligmosomoides polygyrus]